MINLSQAILSLDSNAKFSYEGENVDTIILVTSPITKEDIVSEQQRLQAIEDAK